MWNRLTLKNPTVFAIALMSVAALSMPGQAVRTGAETGAKSGVPRMRDGHPDLQGTYDLATITPLERLPGDPPVLTKEKAEALEKAETARRADFLAEDEHDQISVLLDRSRLAEIGQLRTMISAAALRRAAQL